MFTDAIWKPAAGALAVALAGVSVYALVLKMDLQEAKVDKVEQKASWDKERSTTSEAISNLKQKYIDLSLTRSEEARINDQRVKNEQDKTAAALDAGRVLRDSLRVSTQKYATLFAERGSVATPEPGTAEYSLAVSSLEYRAKNLGSLLERCDALSERLATDAEGLATQVRGLQAAYHSLEKK